MRGKNEAIIIIDVTDTINNDGQTWIFEGKSLYLFILVRRRNTVIGVVKWALATTLVQFLEILHPSTVYIMVWNYFPSTTKHYYTHP